MICKMARIVSSPNCWAAAAICGWPPGSVYRKFSGPQPAAAAITSRK